MNQPRRVAVAAIALMLTLSCSDKPAQAPPVKAPPPPPPAKITTRAVTLYYEQASRKLGGITREIALPDNDAAAIRPLLQALFTPPPEIAEQAPIPQGLVVNATYLLPDGTAIVDLGGPLLDTAWNAGSDAEVMLVYSIVETITANLHSIRQVQILVKGQQAETFAGHVSIDRPLRPLRALVEQTAPPTH
jgi:hypothetical protein